MQIAKLKARVVTPALLIAMALASECVVAQSGPPAGPPPSGAAGGPPDGMAAATERTVQEIKFTGNSKIPTATLAAQIPLKVGVVNTKEAVGAAMNKIVEIYRQAGSDLSLMVDISLPDATHTIVNFMIDENGAGGNKGAAPRAGGGGPPPAK